MKTATLLLLPCLWSCSVDASGFLCPQSEPIAPVAFEPVSRDCPEWPVSLDLHECSWDSVVDPGNCSEYGRAECPDGWEVLESVAWDGAGTVTSFDARARKDEGPWCAYIVTFERGDQ